MANRLGSTIVALGSAKQHRYAAAMQGSRVANYAGKCEVPLLRHLVGLRDKRMAWLDHLSRETQWPGDGLCPGTWMDR